VYLETLFEHSPEAIVIIDRNSRVLQVNRRFCNTFGYAESEALGQDIDDLIVPSSMREEASDLTQTALVGMEAERQSFRHRKDGSLFPVSILAAPIFVNGSLIALYVIYRDLSTVRETERQLKQTQSRLDAVISQAPIVIFTLDKDGRFTFCAGRAMQQVGLTEADMLGKSTFDLFPDLPEALSATGQALQGHSAMAGHQF
jgi:two-component system, cell cycle sensor histidine kinase and response regulator CckA